jgi:hypothetical protein
VLASHPSLATQAPDTQLWLLEHDEHEMPPCPHALSESPDTHWPPSQHPSQFSGLQDSSVHLPNLQVSPVSHDVHEAPLLPQSDADVCPMQVSDSLQHPAQFEGPQGGEDSLPAPPSSDPQPAAIKANPATRTVA